LKKKEEPALARKETDASAVYDTAPPVVDAVLASSGTTLDTSTRAFMEGRFGYNFADVRVHADGQAAASARAVGARAYTVGTHVVFGTGEYTPQSEGGRHLLAHELTHVVQQDGGAAQRVQRASGSV